MLFFATPGGALAMYHVKWTGMNALSLWLTPFLIGCMTVVMGLVTLIWFYDMDYMEDCRWRDQFFQCLKKRSRVYPTPIVIVTAGMRDRAIRDKRLSITSAAAT
jgi:hypothetical protein